MNYSKATILALLLSACQQPDPLAKIAKMQPRTAEEVLAPLLIDRAMSAMVAGPEIAGVMRFIDQPTPCNMDGGVSTYVWPEWKEPRAGEPLRIQWVTRAARPLPDELVSLLISTRKRTAPLDCSPWGHFGCWLVVEPDIIIAPTEQGLLSRAPGDGRIQLAWTPEPAWAGTTFYVQMVVATNETRSGLAVSPGLEVLIGSQR